MYQSVFVNTIGQKHEVIAIVMDVSFLFVWFVAVVFFWFCLVCFCCLLFQCTGKTCNIILYSMTC